MSPELPSQPAAVLLYNNDGCAPVFVVDFDTKKGARPADGACGVDQVADDLAALTRMLEQSGLRSWFTDHSPNGGRHLYLPLAEPVPHHEAKAAAAALSARLATVDPVPMSNLTDGCIRPPGARHKSGGYQVLDGPLETAVDALRHPNAPLAWRRFFRDLMRSMKPLTPPLDDYLVGDVDDHSRLEPLRGYTEPTSDFQRIARTGEFEASRYSSPSDARQAVLWSACASGWSRLDVQRRLEDGTWPGLASFYAKYRSPRRAFLADWHRVVAFEKQRRARRGKDTVRVRTTSPNKARAGRGSPVGEPGVATRARSAGVAVPALDVDGFVRQWLRAVDLLHGPGTDPGTRAVLTALALAAKLSGSVVVEHGNRHLGIASALDHSTVSRVLSKLSSEPSDRALIDLVDPARRNRANVWQLVIPPLLAPACAAQPWTGPIEGIRPAFKELGLPAAFVYAALEQHRHEHRKGRADPTIGGRELAAAARVGVTATYDALATLAAWGLAERSPAGGWKIGGASLAWLAEAWGIADVVRATIARYREERRRWWAWLVSKGLLPAAFLERAGGSLARPDPPPPPPLPWYDETETLLHLLQRELGAQIVVA